jgi:hypothetical protein
MLPNTASRNRHSLPGEVAAHRERQRHGWVEVRAGDGAHEQDDRQHHQAGRDHGGREADLPLPMQDPAAGGDQHQHERPQQFGEQPPVLELGIVEVRTRTELHHQQVMGPLRVVGRDSRGLLVGDDAHKVPPGCGCRARERSSGT